MISPQILLTTCNAVIAEEPSNEKLSVCANQERICVGKRNEVEKRECKKKQINY